MRNSDCKKCRYYSRRTWSHYYIPRDYHPIGMTHAYGYCMLHEKRVRDIRKCDNGGVPRGQLELERHG